MKDAHAIAGHNFHLWLAAIQDELHARLDLAIDVEYFDLPTYFHRIVTNEYLGNDQFMKVAEKTRDMDPESKVANNLVKIREVLEGISIQFTLEDLRASRIVREEYVEAPITTYFWIYMFWSIAGPEEVCESTFIEQALDLMIKEQLNEGKQTFQANMCMMDGRKKRKGAKPPRELKEPLVSFLLGVMDRNLANIRYERSNTKDGDPLIQTGYLH